MDHQTQRVQVPNNQVLGVRITVIIVLVLGKYMIVEYLDPLGNAEEKWMMKRTPASRYGVCITGPTRNTQSSILDPKSLTLNPKP